MLGNTPNVVRGFVCFPQHDEEIEPGNKELCYRNSLKGQMLKVKGFDWGRVRILTEKQVENLKRKGVEFQSGAEALRGTNPGTTPTEIKPEVTVMGKNTGRIVLIVLGFIVLCLAYYCLFPKYEMRIREINIPTSGTEVMRFNRITGSIDVKNPTWEGRYLKGRLF